MLTNQLRTYIGNVQVKAIHGAFMQGEEQLPAPGGINVTVLPGDPPAEDPEE